MVDYSSPIDLVFAALADPVRRNIVERASGGELTVGQIAIEYDMTLAAVSRHLRLLREAGLITRRREGKFQYVRTNMAGLRIAEEYLAAFSPHSRMKPSVKEDGKL